MSKKTIKGKNYEFTPEWSGFDINYEVAGYFDPRPVLQIYFIWGKLFIKLPWRHYKKIELEKDIKDIRKEKLSTLCNKKIKIKKKYKKELYDQCQTPRYGVGIYDKMLTFRWGYNSKSFRFPWYYIWTRTSVLCIDEVTWYNETIKTGHMEFYDTKKWEGKLFSETHPFKYTTKYGEEQNCLATITVEEREWRWVWFTWLKYTRKIRKDIEVKFSDDIGERKGSWKGGTTGCGYTMRKGETPYDTLKRMERERKF